MTVLRTLALATLGWTTAANDPQRQEGPRNDYQRSVAPLISRYCSECHSGEDSEAGLDLTAFQSAADVLDDADGWQRVREMLQLRQMPPEGWSRPSETEYLHLLRWLEEKLGPELEVQLATGHVTARRLNRVEYHHTVRDLLGVDYDVQTHLPADAVGHGFDNIGEVLSLSPLLLEKYITAAEEIAAMTIVDKDPRTPPKVRMEAGQLLLEGGGSLRGKAQFLTSHGEVFFEHRFPREGTYLLRAEAYGQQAGPDPVRISFCIDGTALHEVDVPAEEANPGSYVVETRVKRGLRRFGVKFINDYYRPEDPDPKQRDRNCGILALAIEGPVDPQVFPETHQQLISSEASRKRRGVDLTRIVRHLGERAFRRPLTSNDLSRLRRAIDRATPSAASFESRVRCAIVTLLVSPEFLFRIERVPDQGEMTRRLDGFELASRLSYFLWSSMPDDPLLAHARAGDLQEEAVLRKELRRMLADPKSIALAENFATQWLQIRDVVNATPDAQQFPQVDRNLLQSMLGETVRFFHAILQEDRQIEEILDADFTFVDAPLGQHYGMEVGGEQGFQRVTDLQPRGGGVLHHASVLTATSHPTRTSPVRRGKWVLEALLNSPPPPPPPGFDSLEEEAEGSEPRSFRERLEQHRADPRCSTCHERMDPLGLALEHYDATGRWREKDGDFEIDDQAALPDGRQFQGVAGLAALLKEGPAFRRSLCRHLLTYALGRGLNTADEDAITHLGASLDQKPTLSHLIEEIVYLDLFREQGTDDPTEESHGK